MYSFLRASAPLRKRKRNRRVDLPPTVYLVVRWITLNSFVSILREWAFSSSHPCPKVAVSISPLFYVSSFHYSLYAHPSKSLSIRPHFFITLVLFIANPAICNVRRIGRSGSVASIREIRSANGSSLLLRELWRMPVDRQMSTFALIFFTCMLSLLLNSSNFFLGSSTLWVRCEVSNGSSFALGASRSTEQ